MKFFIVDAFTDEVFNGNPAGVVILPEGEGFPADEVMRKTAAELRYSETAFIRPMGESEYHLRYFTPTDEVDLCGHATVGSFWAMKEEGIIPADGLCKAHTLAGDLEIRAKEDHVLMEMGAPCRYPAPKPEETEELFTILGVSTADIPEGLHPEIITTGLPDLMMPLSSRQILDGMAPDMEALADYSRRHSVVGVHAFVPAAQAGTRGDGTDKGLRAQCRNFAPLYGIPEEAATGTSNGALTYYLYLYGMVQENEDNWFLQGEAMGRPSRIMSRLVIERTMACRTCGIHEEPKIFVGGRAAILAQGEIRI